jgi:hypothetical protein
VKVGLLAEDSSFVLAQSTGNGGEWVGGGREVYNMDAMDAGIKAQFCFDPVSSKRRYLLTY